MPKYFYSCNNCASKHSFYHGMFEARTTCPACEVENVLKKLPSSFSYETENEEEKKVGDLVEDSIKTFREELNKQKEDLKKEYDRKNK